MVPKCLQNTSSPMSHGSHGLLFCLFVLFSEPDVSWIACKLSFKMICMICKVCPPTFHVGLPDAVGVFKISSPSSRLPTGEAPSHSRSGTLFVDGALTVKGAEALSLWHKT